MRTWILSVIGFCALLTGYSQTPLAPPLPAGSTYYKGKIVSQQGVGVIGCTNAQFLLGDGSGCAASSGGPPSGAASGDLCNSYPAPTVCKINGTTIPSNINALTINAIGQPVAQSGAQAAAQIAGVPIAPSSISGSGAVTDTIQNTVIANTSYNAFPGLAYLNGTWYATYRAGASHAGTVGTCMLTTSTNKYTWTTPTVIENLSPLDCRDPSITALSNGNLIVSFFSDNTSNTVYTAYTTISSNLGVSWSTPVGIQPFPTNSALSAPVVEIGGNPLTLVLPVYGDNAPGILVMGSSNGGASWSVIGSPTLAGGGVGGLVEPRIAVTTYGLFLTARDLNQPQSEMATATSANNGVTWTGMVDKFAANSRADTIQLHDGRLLAAYRSPDQSTSGGLATRVSYDGSTWTPEAASALETAYVYSAMLEEIYGDVTMIDCEQSSGSVASCYLQDYPSLSSFQNQPAISAQGLQLQQNLVLEGLGGVIVSPGTLRDVVNTPETATGATQLVFQAGSGSDNYGGALDLFGAGNATRPGAVIAGIPYPTGEFCVSEPAISLSADLFCVKDVAGVPLTHFYTPVSFDDGAPTLIYNSSLFTDVILASSNTGMGRFFLQNGTSSDAGGASLTLPGLDDATLPGYLVVGLPYPNGSFAVMLGPKTLISNLFNVTETSGVGAINANVPLNFDTLASIGHGGIVLGLGGVASSGAMAQLEIQDYVNSGTPRPAVFWNGADHWDGIGVDVGSASLDIVRIGFIDSITGGWAGSATVHASDFLSDANPTAAGTGEISYGGTTSAASNCGLIVGAAGCVNINIAGTNHYVPYF